MTLRDPEVLELLADDPRLLALADAVAATQQAPRRPLLHRAGPRVAAVAVVAAAAVVVALVVPKGEHGIVDRAIAAIGDGRVMHVITEMPTGASMLTCGVVAALFSSTGWSFGPTSRRTGSMR